MVSQSKVAVVTGASRGIGACVAVDLAAAGYDVVCVARSSNSSPGLLPGTIEDTVARVVEQGQRGLPIVLDVRDETAVHDLATKVQREYGRCDLVVNNAAVAPPGTTADIALKHWQLAFDVNVHGPMYITRHFGAWMREQGGGRIINVSSSASIDPEVNWVSYTVTKAALEALTLSCAAELAPNVAVNCIRLELNVYSEGYEARLGEDLPGIEFEHPIVMGDAVRWFAGQPLTMTGAIKTIAELREIGVVRPRTEWLPKA